MIIELFHDTSYDNWQPHRAWGWQIRAGHDIVSWDYHVAPSEDAARADAEQRMAELLDMRAASKAACDCAR